MYTSKHYTCEQIDERLVQGYYNDAVAAGFTGTFGEFLEGINDSIKFANNPKASQINLNPVSGLGSNNMQGAIKELNENLQDLSQNMGDSSGVDEYTIEYNCGFAWSSQQEKMIPYGPGTSYGGIIVRLSPDTTYRIDGVINIYTFTNEPTVESEDMVLRHEVGTSWIAAEGENYACCMIYKNLQDPVQVTHGDSGFLKELKKKADKEEVEQIQQSVATVDEQQTLGTDEHENKVTPSTVYAIMDSPEFAIAFVDKQNHFLFGIRKNGQFKVFNRDLTRALQLVDEQIEGKEDVFEATTMEENNEFLKAIIDSSGNVIFGIKKTGDVYFGVGVPSQIKDAIESIDISSLDGISELIEAETNRAKSKENEIAGNVNTLANTVSGVSSTATAASEDAATALNLAQQAIEEQRYEIQGDVTNNPDEEDITVNSASKLCIKDRVYSPSAVTTKGYVILRQGTALSTQMSGKTNTIFEVRYVFDLNNATLELPENSTLLFVGGKFSDGTIQGNKSVVTTVDDILLFEDVTLTGTWNNTRVDSRWFNFETSALVTNHDDKINFGNLMALANGNVLTDVYIQEGYYHTTLKKYTGTATATMVIPSHTHIHNMGTIEQITDNTAERQALFLAVQADDVMIEGGSYIGDCDSARTYGNRDHCHCIKISGCTNVQLRDLNIKEFWGDGIDLVDASNGSIENKHIVIERVVSNYNGRQGMSVESAHDSIVRDCEFCYTGTLNHEGTDNRGPWAGIDFEPWNANTPCKIKNVSFENVIAHDNSLSTYAKQYDLQYIPNVWYRATPDGGIPSPYINTAPKNDVTFVNCKFGRTLFEDANGAKFTATDLGAISWGTQGLPTNFEHDGTGISKRGTGSEIPTANIINILLPIGFPYYNTSTSKLLIYNGGTWTEV